MAYNVEFQHLKTGGWFGHQPAETIEQAHEVAAAELRTRGLDEDSISKVMNMTAGETAVDMPEVGLAVRISRN